MSALDPVVPPVIFDADDIGCYADGTFGHGHCREVLAGLISDLIPTAENAQLVKALSGEMSDDAWEEDDALDLLNEHTAAGQTWQFYEGDLGLYSDDGEDS